MQVKLHSYLNYLNNIFICRFPLGFLTSFLKLFKNVFLKNYCTLLLYKGYGIFVLLWEAGKFQEPLSQHIFMLPI